MSGPDWYRWYPSKWLAGTLTLTNEQRGVYIQIINVIYDRGECPADEDYLMRLCSCHRRVLRRVIGELIEAGKIERAGDKLEQKRAKLERNFAETFVQTQRNRAVKGWQTRHLDNANSGNANYSNKKEDSRVRPVPTEPSTEAPNGAVQDRDLDLDAELYKHGKRILGLKAGGVITRIRATFGVGQGLNLIEQASHKENPMEYVQRALRRGVEPDDRSRTRRDARGALDSLMSCTGEGKPQ